MSIRLMAANRKEMTIKSAKTYANPGGTQNVAYPRDVYDISGVESIMINLMIKRNY